MHLHIQKIIPVFCFPRLPLLTHSSLFSHLYLCHSHFYLSLYKYSCAPAHFFLSPLNSLFSLTHLNVRPKNFENLIYYLNILLNLRLSIRNICVLFKMKLLRVIMHNLLHSPWLLLFPLWVNDLTCNRAPFPYFRKLLKHPFWPPMEEMQSRTGVKN